MLVMNVQQYLKIEDALKESKKQLRKSMDSFESALYGGINPILDEKAMDELCIFSPNDLRHGDTPQYREQLRNDLMRCKRNMLASLEAVLDNLINCVK